MVTRKIVVALGVAALLGGGVDVSSAAGDVTINSQYLTDTDGYDYGVEYYLSSTVDVQTCVYPRVVTRSNVNGDVTSGPVIMQASEGGFPIGQFIAADQSMPWEVNVAARWTEC